MQTSETEVKSVKCLIVGPSWVGDMVMAQTLAIGLKKQNPAAVIDVLAPEWSLPIVERMPEIRRGFAMTVGHGKLELRLRMALAGNLKAEQYQQAFILPNSLKSALVPFFARIPIRTGWRGEMRYGLLNDLRKLDKKQYPLMAERFHALAFPAQSTLPKLPYPQLTVDPAEVTNAKHRHSLDTDRPILAMCPGAEFGPAKQWPAGYFSEVARTQIESGWRVWLFGSPKDADVGHQIFHQLPAHLQGSCSNLIGRTSLGECVDLMSLTTAVVSNDSGLMHVACAVDKPVVALFGPTPKAFTPPLSRKSRSLSLDLPCSPCSKKVCPLGHMECMKKLSPEMVMDALHDQIDNHKLREQD